MADLSTGGGGGGGPGPISDKHAAVTFDESFLSLSHTDTEATGGEVKLPVENDSVSLSEDGSTSTDAERGVIVTLTANAGSLDVSLMPSVAGVTTAYLRDASDDSLITSKSISGDFSFSNVSAGTYAVTIDAGGSSYDTADNGVNGPEPESEFIDVGDGFNSAAPDNRSDSKFNLDSIAINNSSPPTSGQAIVEFENPDDIFRWDSATFQTTEDGETVTIDVEESTDGGASWTAIATDIQRGQDISDADPTGLVRLVINIDRSNTANNPTCDSVARRWVL